MNPSTNSASPFQRELILQRPYAGRILQNIAYKDGDSEQHACDIYLPENSTGPVPCVLVVPGFNDEGYRKIAGSPQKDSKPGRSLARLLAASGLAAVAYQVRDPLADGSACLEFLQRRGPDYGIDPARIALWASSGNVPTALGLLDRQPGLAGAVLLYGYMLDADDDPVVSTAASQFRFAHPPLSADFPHGRARCLVVQAGQDEMPGLNQSIDYFLRAAARSGMDVELLCYEGGVHAFDLHDESAEARACVETILEFLQQLLKPECR